MPNKPEKHIQNIKKRIKLFRYAQTLARLCFYEEEERVQYSESCKERYIILDKQGLLEKNRYLFLISYCYDR